MQITPEYLDDLTKRSASVPYANGERLFGFVVQNTSGESDEWIRECLGLREILALAKDGLVLKEALKTLEQIALFAPPTVPQYENARNIIRDIQWIARDVHTRLSRANEER